MLTHLTDKDRKEIAQAATFQALAEVALRVINRAPYPLTQVCGPITSGGGTVAENMKKFAVTIDRLSKSGEWVFSQLPFEKELYRLARAEAGKGYCYAVLEKFYRPIFESGKITRVYFLPGWEDSTGARWEYVALSELAESEFSIEIMFLPEGAWHDRNILY